MKGYYRYIMITICFFAAAICLQAQGEAVVSVYSNSMQKEILNTVITPDDYNTSAEHYPTVYLLHGAGGDHRQWIQMVPDLQALASRYDFIIVCPDGGFTSWYLDSPVDPTYLYETYVADELVQEIDRRYRTIASAQGRAISGLSMGGHGAFYLAIRHQDTYGAAGSMSGGLDIRPFPKNWDLPLRLGEQQDNWENWNNCTSFSCHIWIKGKCGNAHLKFLLYHQKKMSSFDSLKTSYKDEH